MALRMDNILSGSREVLISFKTIANSIEISTANLRFKTTESSKKCHQAIATTTDNRKFRD